MLNAMDLSSCVAATVELLRFVDVNLDSGEYLTVEAWDGSTWHTLGLWQGGDGDDDIWHAETFDVTAYVAAGDFRLRLRTKENRADEHVQVDDVRILGAGCGQ